jgi:hypothetical protein
MLMIFSTSFGRKLESRAAGEPAVAEWYDSAPSDCAAGDDAYRGDAAALPVRNARALALLRRGEASNSAFDVARLWADPNRLPPGEESEGRGALSSEGA